jgi:hypothetical protein
MTIATIRKRIKAAISEVHKEHKGHLGKNKAASSCTECQNLWGKQAGLETALQCLTKKGVK